MKLSMESYVPVEKFGVEKGLEIIKNAGFDAVDWSFYWQTKESDILGDGYIDYAKNVRCILDKTGLSCNQAHAPFEFRYGGNFDVSDEKYKDIVRAMESASIMGAENIIVHSIAVPFGEDVMDYNLRFYKSLEPYCEKSGIKIAVENLFSWDEKSGCCRGRIHTPELLYEIIEKLDSPWFVVCIDVGHAAVVGIEPDEIIRALDNKILKALHVHDNDYKMDRHLFPYSGNFDWNKIMSALKDISYDGDFTMEIFAQLKKCETEFIPEAVNYAGKIGRFLIDKIK